MHPSSWKDTFPRLNCLPCPCKPIPVSLTLEPKSTFMRKRKPTNGRVTGVKFEIKKDDSNDLKKAKAEALKELEEREKNKDEWYDKEIDKNMK